MKSRMRNLITAVMAGVAGVCGLAALSRAETTGHGPFVHAFFVTESGTRYETLGDMASFKYYQDADGNFILCVKSVNTVGLPEMGPPDEIFSDGFDKDPCDI